MLSHLTPECRGSTGSAVFGSPSLGASDRYVAPGGANAGNCSVQPCASISYALGQSASGDTINVANGTYTEQLVIDKDVVIKGANRRFTIVQASSNPNASPGRVVRVQAPAVGQPFRQVEISRMTIRHGLAQGPAPHNRGGGIYVEAGNLTLDNVILASNRAQFGGGLYCVNSLGWTLRNVRFENNSVINGLGGGMYSSGCTASFNVAVFEDNAASSSAVTNGHGGALFNTNSSVVSLSRVDFINNSAGYHGGAVYTSDNSALTISRASFEANSAVESGGAIFHDERSLTIRRTEFTNNTSGPTGGAMRVDGADVELANVRFLNNSSSSGGSIFSGSVEGSLVNALFADNSANFGAGLYQSSSDWVVYNSTFSSNASNSGAAVFQTTAVCFSPTPSSGKQRSDPGVEMVNSGGTGSMTIGFSLIAMGCPTSASCNEVLNVNPQFANPGEGDFELAAASPAIDAGNPGTPAAVFPVNAQDSPIDLNANPRFINNRIDMGSFEYQTVALPDPPDLLNRLTLRPTLASPSHSSGVRCSRLMNIRSRWRFSRPTLMMP
jgi:predicted outer membrane repeat protein